MRIGTASLPRAVATASTAVADPVFLAPRLRHAGAVLHAGRVIAYPTEGVYGLGCRPDDGQAVRHLLELKQRPAAAGLILIAASLDGSVIAVELLKESVPPFIRSRLLLAPSCALSEKKSVPALNCVSP